MNQILASAVAGAIGGGLMGLIVFGIDKLRGKPTGLSRYIVPIGALLAVALVRTLNHPSTEPSDIEKQIDADPEVRVVHRYYPDVYKQLIDKLTSVSASGTNLIADEDEIRPILSTLTLRQIKYADDYNISSTFKIIIDEASTARDVSPAYCMAVVNGGGQFGFDAVKVFTDDERKADVAETAKMLEQTANHPHTATARISQSQMRQLSRTALSTLDAADRASATRVLQASRQPIGDVEQRAYCNFTIAVFKTALSISPDVERALVAPSGTNQGK